MIIGEKEKHQEKDAQKGIAGTGGGGMGGARTGPGHQRTAEGLEQRLRGATSEANDYHFGT